MKKIMLITGIFLGFSLTGCAVYTPAGSVVVDPNENYDRGGHDDGGKFCPPGQAKKGNC